MLILKYGIRKLKVIISKLLTFPEGLNYKNVIKLYWFPTGGP